MAAPGAEPPCDLCAAAAAPYTCPRCNRRLCSLRCYRGHGACAEAFYRRQVLQALSSQPRPPRLDAACHRLPQLREAEDSPGPGGLDLWQSLSPGERADFRRLLNSGEAEKLLPPWRPWWWRGRGRGGEEEEEALNAPPPPLPATIPPLSSFPGPPPSPLLPFQLPNVLYAYAFALSLHRGDESLLPDLPAAAIDVSVALRHRRAFSSVGEALAEARHDARRAGYPLCPLGDGGTILAVAELLEGGGVGGILGVVAALAHLERLLRRGKRAGEGQEERRHFGNAARKCRYLLAWSWEEPEETLAELAKATRRFHADMGLVSAGGNEKRLVEELD